MRLTVVTDIDHSVKSKINQVVPAVAHYCQRSVRVLARSGVCPVITPERSWDGATDGKARKCSVVCEFAHWNFE
jgi:hypothetical protein